MAVGDTLEIIVAIAFQVAIVERIIQESMDCLLGPKKWRFDCICMFVFFFCLQKVDQDMDHFGSRVKTTHCYKKGGRSIEMKSGADYLSNRLLMKYSKRLAN